MKEICDTVKNGQVFTTYGPFIKFSVNGKGMGETVQAERAAVRLKVEVHAADWIDVDRVLVIVDGDVVETIPVPDTREIVRLIDERKILARAVFVLDGEGTVIYAEPVPEVASEPNYDAAIAALEKAVG